MKKYISILLTSITITLVACGGSDSSSENSSGALYTGTQTLKLQGTSIPAAFAMRVSDTTVTITDKDFTASGALNGNTFTVVVKPVTASQSGITCTFNFIYRGTLEASTKATGSINGSASCQGGATININGSFTANAGSGKQLIKTLSQAVTELTVK